MQTVRTPREAARLANATVDRALVRPTPAHRHEVLALVKVETVQKLAERIRRRATLIGRRERNAAQAILAQRDALIMGVYASAAPQGWASAWCDGSSIGRGRTRRAGIGVVLWDERAAPLAQLTRAAGDRTAFDAELAAMVTTLELALAHRIDRLTVHTDSKALAQLWHQHRDDPRLAPIGPLAGRFKAIRICAIPRLHNQVANALAQQAAREPSH